MNRFDLRWRKALDAEGLKEFHANRFWARFNGAPIPEYKDWDRPKCMRFLATLLEIIKSHRIFPVSAAVIMQDWAQLSVDERALLTGAVYKENSGQLVGAGAPNKVFFFPFVWCVSTPLRYCNPGLVMDFFFDRNEFVATYAQDYYDFLRRAWTHHPRKMGKLSFVDSEKTSPIQAADLLAYELNRYAKERIKQNMGMPDRNPSMKIATRNQRGENDCALFNKPGIDNLLKPYRATKTSASEGGPVACVP